jgi:hypothetical protein
MIKFEARKFGIFSICLHLHILATVSDSNFFNGVKRVVFNLDKTDKLFCIINCVGFT